MPDAAINPTSTGATTYEVTNTRALIADLALDVPVSVPFPTFDIRYPTGAAELDIKLVKNAVELNLLPGPFTDDPTFVNRLVSTSSAVEGPATILTCEIRASAMATINENWQVKLRARSTGIYQLTQIDNIPAKLTIRRLMCDPVARFTIGGEATSGDGGVATVREKGSVTLQATPAIGPATAVTVAEIPAPQTSYRWSLASATGAVVIPELPACSDNPRVEFFAPHVTSSTELRLRIETWFDGACPETIGWLNSSADRSLRVEPVGATFLLGPEGSIAPSEWLNMYPCFLLDQDNGIIAVWAAFGRPSDSGGTICTSRLKLHDVAGGFSPAQAITAIYSSTPAAVLLPSRELVVAYRRDKDKGTATQTRNSCFKRARLSDLSAAPEQPVSNDSEVSDPSCFLSSELITFIYRGPVNSEYRFRRYRVSDGSWLDSASQSLFPANGFGSLASAGRDSSGNIWFSFTSNRDSDGTAKDWRAFRFTPGTGARNFETAESFTGEKFSIPWSNVFCLNSEDVWVFRQTNTGPQFSRCVGGAWQNKQLVPQMTVNDSLPLIVVDSSGVMWIFWGSRDANGVLVKNFVMRHNPSTGEWGQPRELQVDGLLESVLITANNTIWVFYSRDVKDKAIINLFYRRILI